MVQPCRTCLAARRSRLAESQFFAGTTLKRHCCRLYGRAPEEGVCLNTMDVVKNLLEVY